jgi:hypothetical protein
MTAGLLSAAKCFRSVRSATGLQRLHASLTTSRLYGKIKRNSSLDEAVKSPNFIKICHSRESGDPENKVITVF